eukprot:Gregarina_sp_Pseudo_9__2664@NODE_2914_length_826_cov_69_449809_g2663_i0_p1_GENE_NODE_2914_length_826_cov_69_449809_g2663_i0NODE_2914_length_826_cov_69_449809_g2663_i0_p1_ORF_typecomplete_len195_score27_59_NODE_2914_length_826_cov_69_449809_g2663_i0198782
MRRSISLFWWGVLIANRSVSAIDDVFVGEGPTLPAADADVATCVYEKPTEKQRDAQEFWQTMHALIPNDTRIGLLYMYWSREQWLVAGHQACHLKPYLNCRECEAGGCPFCQLSPALRPLYKLLPNQLRTAWRVHKQDLLFCGLNPDACRLLEEMDEATSFCRDGASKRERRLALKTYIALHAFLFVPWWSKSR